MSESTVKVLGIADSDSYLKWLAMTLAHAPAEWTSSIVVADAGAVPSPTQTAAALTGSPFGADDVQVATRERILDRIRAEEPDVVVLATRGPSAWLLLDGGLATMPQRPVIVTGLPGISIPATELAITYRSGADVFVVHSLREVRDFERIARGTPLEGRFALGSLPFAHRTAGAAGGNQVVFAAQAAVPKGIDDRRYLLDALVELAELRPDLEVVVKVRAGEGEAQTHAEAYPYPLLLEQIRKERAKRGDELPGNIVVSAAPMAAHLAHATGLVTVSSTAAIEAVAAGIPCLVLSDFGISAKMINLVFLHSGVLGNLGDLVEGRFSTVREDWLEDNYFHASEHNDWIPRTEALIAARRHAALPATSTAVNHTLGWLERVRAEHSALADSDHSARAVAVKAVVPVSRLAGRVARAVERAFR